MIRMRTIGRIKLVRVKCDRHSHLNWKSKLHYFFISFLDFVLLLLRSSLGITVKGKLGSVYDTLLIWQLAFLRWMAFDSGPYYGITLAARTGTRSLNPLTTVVSAIPSKCHAESS